MTNCPSHLTTPCFAKPQRQTDFSTIFHVDPGQFVQGLPLLKVRLETNLVSEQICRTRNRIDLAHFHNAYRVAQDNPDAFLQWTANDVSATRRKGRKDSLVKQRLVNILFSESIFR